MRFRKSFAAATAALTAFSGGEMFKRGGPEAPPPGITGPAPGYSEEYLDPLEVDRLCRALGVDANDQWNRKRIIACVAPKARRIILPKGATQETKLHEYGHSWGYTHNDGGKGWVKAPNVFAQAPVQHDWGNAFAKPQENIFRGR